MEQPSQSKKDFLTLHHAYVDEWITVSYLPMIKTTYNGESNYYDIGTLNLKNINPRNYPFSEQIFMMDRHFASVKSSFDRLLAETAVSEIDRMLRIETYQSSFQTFMERMKMVLEKNILELGGTIPTHLENMNVQAVEDHLASLMDKDLNAKRFTMMARSRLPGFTSTPSITAITGPISILWNEVLFLVNQTESTSAARNLKIQQIIGTISHFIFEWRVMFANSQKIINEDKRFKKNPFQTPSYDQISSTFNISSPVLISTSNPNFQQLMSSSIPSGVFNQPNYNSTGSNNAFDFNSGSGSYNSNSGLEANFESFALNSNPNYTSTSTDTSPTSTLTTPVSRESILAPTATPPPGSNSNLNLNSGPQSPGGANSWQRAFKRITTFPGGQPPSVNSNQSNLSVNQNNASSISVSSNQSSGSLKEKEKEKDKEREREKEKEKDKDKEKEDSTPIGGIMKSGWMKKRGGKNKSWKKRFFILDMKKTLRYYNYHKEKASKDSKDTSSQNMYNISHPILQPTSIIVNSNGNLHNVNLENSNPYTPSSSNSSSAKDSKNHENNININNSGNSISTVNNSNPGSVLLDVTNYENLKYKGSIDLYTSLVVAIKPNTCNINLIDHSSPNNVKDDSGSYFGMDIITPKRTWHLCCDSQKSMEEWLVVLKSANK